MKMPLEKSIRSDISHLAHQEAVTRILNTYLRETGDYDPRIKLDEIDYYPFQAEQGNIFIVNCTKTATAIVGVFTYWSQGGHHAYGTKFYLQKTNKSTFIPADYRQVIACVLDELAYLEPDEKIRSNKRENMLRAIGNSITKTEAYLQNLQVNKKVEDRTFNFLRSEQSLYYGHPFHPAPKSSEGFSNEDIEKYAPEFGVSFALHYFAVSPELIREEWIGEEGEGIAEKGIPEKVQREAKRKLTAEQKDFKLLPCHPWQANYLSNWEMLIQLMEQQKVIDLGPLGNVVSPTSSVRTVWDPNHKFMFKLPLNIRITNFIRVNTSEQIRRSLDAGKLIAALRQDVEHETIGFLLEYGFRTLLLPYSSEADKEHATESFSVLFRENSADFQQVDSQIFVVGSLLEIPLGESEPSLFSIMRQSQQGETPDITKWLLKYLNITMIPVLTLFAETGVSLEAHAQNSMLKMNNGWPEKFYVRDLEGISIDKEQAEEKGWIGQLISENSPILYKEEETWQRLNYYYFVNHLIHIVHTLAKYSGTDELVYWQVVRNLLQEVERESISLRLKKYINHLLNDRTLAAKANLISRFQARGETPLYVNIPNPIYSCEERL
ncbi:IucA/IucC family protein [Salipaludibacillus sp. HK11]|uniref:IucA/IucC family protein n=1 Tax=Salipaludibacillus sp. HK11 TaxID=3394320 RepID=UPI0039FD4E96